MIVIDLTLWSAHTGLQSSLGLITISNMGEYAEVTGVNKKRRRIYADYDVRGYAKGTPITRASLHTSKPIRQAIVRRHPKHSKPVWNLVLKALQELDYAG